MALAAAPPRVVLPTRHPVPDGCEYPRPHAHGSVTAGSGAEAQLVASAQAGDPEAFEQLVRLHADRLYAVVVRVVAVPDRCERGHPGARAPAGRPLPAPLDEGPGRAADESKAPHVRAEAHDLREALEAAIMDLPIAYRVPLVLRDVEGLSTAEAAHAMGLGEAAFKSRLHRARLAVRAAVEPYVTDEDDA